MSKQARPTKRLKKRAPAGNAAGKRPRAGNAAGKRRTPGSSPAWDQPPGRDRSAARQAVRELSWMHFDALVGELSRNVLAATRPQVVVGVAHGGVFVGGAIARALRCEFFPVRITRRSRDSQGGSAPRMSGKMPSEVKGKRLLIVDDVSSSGDTLALACTLATKAGAREVQTAVLLQRPDGYAPDFAALITDELVVFPWDYQPLVEDARFGVKDGR